MAVDNAARSPVMFVSMGHEDPAPLPASLSSTPFTRQEALDAGVQFDGGCVTRALDSPSRRKFGTRLAAENELIR